MMTDKPLKSSTKSPKSGLTISVVPREPYSYFTVTEAPSPTFYKPKERIISARVPEFIFKHPNSRHNSRK